MWRTALIFLLCAHAQAETFTQKLVRELPTRCSSQTLGFSGGRELYAAKVNCVYQMVEERVGAPHAPSPKFRNSSRPPAKGSNKPLKF